MATPVTIPGAEPFSAAGTGERGRVGVVVVHGFTGNPNSTRPVGARLAHEGYAVEVPLLPGHGTEVADLAGTRYRQWRGEVERVVDALRARTEQLVLVGLSWGGTLVLDVASGKRAEQVRGVVAINAQLLAPRGPLARLAPLLQHVVATTPRRLAGAPPDDIAKPGADERAYGHIPARAAQSLVVELPRIRAQLSAATLPLLVAWSPQDHTVAPESSRALLAVTASRDVTEVVLERSFHVATLDYDAPVLEDAIVTFVSRVTGV